MAIRLSEGLKPSPHESWLKAHELYERQPGPLMWAFKELPTVDEIHEERVRRLAYPDLLPFMKEFEDLLMPANVTPYWTGRLLSDLLNQWHDGVFKPGISPIKKAGELQKEELREWLVMRTYSDLLEDEVEELVINNAEIREPAFHNLGLDDPDGEGIWNPTKAFNMERNAYRRFVNSRREAEELMGELQTQQVMNWLQSRNQCTDYCCGVEPREDDDWYGQFVKLHGEAPVQLWTFPVPSR